MVRQHDHRIDCERMMPARLTKRSVLRQQPQPPLRQIDGEEEAAPGNEVATIVGHAGMLAWCCDDVMGIAALHPSYGLGSPDLSCWRQSLSPVCRSACRSRSYREGRYRLRIV